MLQREVLKQILEQLPLESPAVEVDQDGPALVASVTSSSFSSATEAARQEQVWSYLREKLSEADLNRIDFVFTNAPSDEGLGSPGG